MSKSLAKTPNKPQGYQFYSSTYVLHSMLELKTLMKICLKCQALREWAVAVQQYTEIIYSIYDSGSLVALIIL